MMNLPLNHREAIKEASLRECKKVLDNPYRAWFITSQEIAEEIGEEFDMDNESLASMVGRIMSEEGYLTRRSAGSRTTYIMDTDKIRAYWKVKDATGD